MTEAIANYHKERAAFSALWQAECEKRIVFYRGESGTGKSTLIRVCTEYIPHTSYTLSIDFKDTETRTVDIFSDIVYYLGWERLVYFPQQLSSYEQYITGKIEHNSIEGNHNTIHQVINVSNPEERKDRLGYLTDALLNDICALEKPFIIIFDTFEQSGDETKNLIKRFLSRALHSQQLRVVVAGQNIPNEQSSASWKKVCLPFELTGVKEAAYWKPVVEQMGRVFPEEINDPMSFLQGICFNTKGNPCQIKTSIEGFPQKTATKKQLPLYESLLCQLEKLGDIERQFFILEFNLAQLPRKIRQAVEILAITHFFDFDLANSLMEESLTNLEFKELTQLSFIEEYPREGFFNVHERTRLLLLDKLWKEQPDIYREISRRAFHYCQQQDQDTTTWRIETLYHQVIAEPEEGIDELENTANEWYNPPNYAYDKIEILTRTLHEHIDNNRLNISGKHTVLYWEGVIDWRYSRLFDAKKKLQQINLDLETRDYFKANCLLRLGEVHLSLSELGEARGVYEQALPIYCLIGDKLGEANCLRSLGDVDLYLSELGEARGLYEQALPIYRLIGDKRGEANCLFRLGDVHLRLSELGEARGLYEQALPIFCLIGSKLGEANCLLSLGEVYLKQNQIEQAEQFILNAQHIYQAISESFGQADSLRMLGLLAIQKGDYANAQSYFEQAQKQLEEIGDKEGVAEVLEAFAKLHTAQNHPDQARDYWQQAIELYEKYGMPKRADKCRQRL